MGVPWLLLRYEADGSQMALRPMWPSLPSVQFGRSVVSNSLRPHELQHARPPCPSPTPEVHSDSRFLGQSQITELPVPQF